MDSGLHAEDSGFQSLAGSQFLELNSGFQSPGKKFPNSRFHRQNFSDSGKCVTLHEAIWWNGRRLLLVIVTIIMKTMTLLLFNIKELKQRRFWATHVKRKWGVFPFNITWRYQIRIAKFLCFDRYDRFARNSWENYSPRMPKISLPVNVRRSKHFC